MKIAEYGPSIGVFLAALATYLLTLCPGVYTEGAGELIGAAYLLGTPHPTGYPLFVLLGRVVTVLLPLQSPAVEINVATALFAAIAAATLTGLLRSRGVGSIAALVAGLALAWGQVFWTQAVIAEVYGLFVAVTLLAVASCLAASAAPTSLRRAILAGYLCGLAVTTHLQAILVLPMAAGLALWPRWQWARSQSRGQLLAVGPFLGGGVLGLSVWLYLPLRNGRGPGFHWAEITTSSGFWHYLTAADYRASFFDLPWAAVMRNAERFMEIWLQEWSLLGVFIGLVGILRLWRLDRSLLTIIGGALLLNLLVALNYHRDPAGFGVFFLLALTCGASLIGYGADELISRWRRPASGVLIGFCLWLVTTHFSQADHSQVRLPGQYGRDLLAGLPEGAVLLIEGDDIAFVVDYLQRLEGVRPDIEVYNRQGRGRTLAQNGVRVGRQREHERREAELWRQGRDLYVVVIRRPPVAGVRFVPHGLAYRLEGPRTPPRTADIVDPTQRLLQAGAGGHQVADPRLAKLAANYWWMAGESFGARGDTAKAVEAYLEAANVADRSQSTLYNVSLRLLNHNELEEALETIEKAISIDPLQEGPYRLASQILRGLERNHERDQLHKRAQFWGVFP
ncbi:MAG: DUF2723 domain-containing protein [Candidatus Latescibacterota bacterium]|nr:DUF2723 domain-containing protein [Candidatus Latescibacterota bacterium]